MINYDLFKSGATTLSTAVKKVVSDTTLASGLGLKVDINAIGGQLGNQLEAAAGQIANVFGRIGINEQQQLKINIGQRLNQSRK